MRRLQRFELLLVPMALAAMLFTVWTGMANGDDAKPAVSIENYAYSPSQITVAAGQSVRFTNNDDVQHTVTDQNGAFDSGLLDTKKSWSYKSDKPGTYAYYCRVHPSMKGTVVVTSP